MILRKITSAALPLALLALQAVAPAAVARTAATRPTTQQVEKLVAALSKDDWKERQKAMSDLAALGPLAEPQLRARMKAKPDAETQTAIEALLQKIAEGSRIAPTLINLRLRSVKAEDAAAALAREGHFEFALGIEALLADVP